MKLRLLLNPSAPLLDAHLETYDDGRPVLVIGDDDLLKMTIARRDAGDWLLVWSTVAERVALRKAGYEMAMKP